MTPERARVILGADVCHPEREPGDNPGPTHLVVYSTDGDLTVLRRICDGRVMVAPVIADSEVPTCERCRRAAAAAQQVLQREGATS